MAYMSAFPACNKRNGRKQVSFVAGPVIVARQVDVSSRPFELPAVEGATPQNSALIVTGFAGTDAEVQDQP